MAPREDLITSAISFLQEPSVVSSPLEKRIEFLKSKNLTQEEIDISLARVNEDPSSSQYQPPPQNQPYYPPQQYQRPPSGYNYNQYGSWQPPPAELPKRDWRDWFIMATVVGGAGYGLWTLSQRYIKPLIAPPTPPQLEQDKAAIDEQFNRAFALLDTLASDTAALKEAEEARTQRLDTVIADVEAVVAELKAANSRREDDSRRMESEIKSMKDGLPKAIDGVKESSERQLRDLSTELGSLKLLMGNRMGGGSSNTFAQRQPAETTGGVRSGTATPAAETAPGSSANVTGSNTAATYPSFATPNFPYTTTSSTYPSSSAAIPISSTANRPKAAAGTASFGSAGGKAAIPAWQMAASSAKPKDFQIASPTVGPTVTTPADGADAVAALQAS